MNSFEVDQWIEWHGGVFPSWSASRKNLQPNERAANAAVIQEDFKGIGLDDAKEASNRLRQRQQIPRADRHVYEVASIARELAKQKQNLRMNSAVGGVTFACQFCHDSGKALVYAGSCTWDSGHADENGQPLTIRERYRRTYATPSDPDLGLRKKLTIPCCCDAGVKQPKLKTRYSELVLGWEIWPPLPGTNRPDLFLDAEGQACVLEGRRRIVGEPLPAFDAVNGEF